MENKENIFISIVMPTYNSAEFIEKSIESVLSQTYKYFELLIIDNNSTDNTSQIISKYKDSRISYTKIFNKGIIAKSRNRNCKGKLDSIS